MKNGFYPHTREGMAQYITDRKICFTPKLEEGFSVRRIGMGNTYDCILKPQELSKGIGFSINVIFDTNSDKLRICIPERRYNINLPYASRPSETMIFTFIFPQKTIEETISLNDMVKSGVETTALDLLVDSIVEKVITKEVQDIFLGKMKTQDRTWHLNTGVLYNLVLVKEYILD